jgi:hypothetical protein
MQNQNTKGILIPESGGDAGLGAIECLEHLEGISLIPVDADTLSPSHYHPNFTSVPYATDESGYLNAIQRLISKHNIKIILPTSDFDAKTLTTDLCF